jgi:signal recognition particle receptor subunit beta
MVQFNFSERTIKAKVVYYGPAQSGKTTNLEQIHRLTDPSGSNSLISLNTGQDRTLFFDLLPFSLGKVSGYDFKVQLYTVPGQVQYNATRRVVLAGADAVVFVADSRKSLAKDNLTAFENMKVNLLANRLVPEKVPVVLQWNKRDLPDLQSEDELNRLLNPWERRAFPAIAARGEGVLETFVAVVQDMLASIAVKYNLKEKGLDPATVPQIVDEAFAKLMEQARSAAPASTEGPSEPTPARIVLSQAPSPAQGATLQATPETGLVSEELLQRAIRSNVELAEALSSLVREVHQGLGSILSHAELLGVYREDARDKRAASLRSIQEEAQRLRRIMQSLGDADAVAEASRSRPAAPAASAATMTSAPSPPAPQPAAPAPPASEVERLLRGAVDGLQGTLAPYGTRVEIRAAPGLALPRVPPDRLTRALSLLVQALSPLSPRATFTLRCEKKPVLLRGRDGSEVRRDFMMLALAHPAVVPPELQQQVVQGSATGPFGDACRLVREAGGFMRFAPLAGGSLESRLFFPV